jgi:hypothetical protein
MALILEQANAKRAVWRNISVEIPKEDGGYSTEKFRAKFQLLEAEDMKDKKEEQIGDFLKEVLLDTKGVKLQKTDTEDTPFTDDLADNLIAVPWIRSALMREYLLIPLGKKGQLKN